MQTEEYTNQVRNKVGLKETDYPHPVPVVYQTFERLFLKNGIKGTKGFRVSRTAKGFGSEKRFGEDPNEKWLNRVEKYNRSVEKKIDPLVDEMPGPAAYSLISTWSKSRAQKEDKTTFNYINNVSRGPSFSIYHA